MRAAPEVRRGTPSRAGLGTVLLYFILGAGALVTLYPVFWLLISSTVTESEVFREPPRFLPGGEFSSNFATLRETLPAFRALGNSLFVTLVITASNVILSAMAGYALAKFDFRGKALVFVLVFATLLLPTELMLVPLYMIMLQLGWVDTYLALIVPFIVTGFGVFLMRQQILNFPDDLLDSARLDGAREMGVFFRVVLPNILPACAALGIVTFMSQWGNFLWPLVIISTPERYTYPLMLSVLVEGGNEVSYAPVLAGAVIGLIPLVAMFLIFQKYIVSGVLDGSLKD